MPSKENKRANMPLNQEREATQIVVEQRACAEPKLLGVQRGPDLCTRIILKRPSDGKTFAVPMTLLAPDARRQLVEVFFRNDMGEFILTRGVREVAARMLKFAASPQRVVIAGDGFHRLSLDGVQHEVVAMGGCVYWLTQRPKDARVAVIGSEQVPRQEGAMGDFSAQFRDVLLGCPRLLVTLLFALAAQLAPAFGVARLSICLIGATSMGKTLIQQVVSRLVYAAAEVRHFDGTSIGLGEYLAAQGERAVFFEDAHEEGMCEPLCHAIMATGNGAEGRLRSGAGGAAAVRTSSAPIRATLILSSEASLADVVRQGRQVLRSGLYARLLEVYPAQHGMFESLCGHETSADLAKHIEAQSIDFAGLVGHEFLRLISGRWDWMQGRWEEKQGGLKAAVFKAAQIDTPSGMADRLCNTLSFIAFIGVVASHLKVLPIAKKDVYAAIGLLLGEQVQRHGRARTPAAQEAVEAVRHFIQTSPNRFERIDQVNGSASIRANLAGYTKQAKGESLYLFFPGEFRKLFIPKFGDEMYRHLDGAGHLRSQEKRGRMYQTRVTVAGQSVPQDFIAVAASILASESE